jgi:hypothetical protein
VVRETPFSFPRAVNAGIIGAGDDDILLLSDDVLLLNPDGFDNMSAFSQQHPEFGLISAAVEGPIVNPEQHPRAGQDWWEAHNSMVATACTYIPRATLDKIGLLDESLIGYGYDDDDLCMRVRQAGMRIAVCGKCLVNHCDLPSMYRSKGSLISSEELNRLADQNRKRFEEKWNIVWKPSNTMPNPKDIIQSLWIGEKLDTMGKLTAASFMGCGHPFHLYTYGKVAGIPAGVIVLDANTIVPKSDIKRFRYLAQFSDWFRYNMILKHGNWWVDTDTVCLRPFDFKDDIVLSRADDPKLVVPNSPMKAPAGSEFMKYLYDESIALEGEWHDMEWSTIGPTLMTKASRKFNTSLKPPIVFNPIPPGKGLEGINKFVDPAGLRFTDDTYAVHLHHSRWTIFDRKGVDEVYPETCAYEVWKKKYGVKTSTETHALHGIYANTKREPGAKVFRDGKMVQLDKQGKVMEEE